MKTFVPQSVLIKKIVQENAMVKSYILNVSVGGKPGQCVNVWLPGVDEKPMSIADDDGKNLTLAIGAVGTFSKALTALTVGERIGIRGPYGKGFTWRKKQHLILVAGGYGAAPLYFASKMASRDECHIDFILGARSKDQLLYESKLRKLKNLRLHIATDDGSRGHKGYNVEILERLLRGVEREEGIAPQSFAMTCGPEMMMKRVSDICWKYTIPAQISVERYMKCGFGICGQCCVDDSGDPVCVKGPVMTNEEVRKIKEFGMYHRDSEGRKVLW
ncbi:dihydroorotate dehydrogenase electron transfer subunit [Candidatus Peregrinibacteria bacterium]|nr:dihydroorotate dehydrogenase electron transfer subunit [Candidatus Peregrinibacteria bacterium]